MKKHHKVVIIGKNGQVATCLQHAASTRLDMELIALGRPEFDLTDDDSLTKLAQEISALSPDIVINPAAYTAVDKAEIEVHQARQINVIAARKIAEGASSAGVPIIHISTDYVFDGTKLTAYNEDDIPSPTSVYGRTKLDGERAVIAANRQATIFRTAWVYSVYGGNFVKTMLRVGADRGELPVVCDQFGCPTSAHDIAAALLVSAISIIQAPTSEKFGTFNLVGTGNASWFDLATHVFSVAKECGKTVPVISPIGTAEYPTPAKRPANSQLDTSKFEAVFNHQMPHWRDSVRTTVKSLLN